MPRSESANGAPLPATYEKGALSARPEGVEMASEQNVPLPASAPAEIVTQPESVRRLLFTAVGWLLLAELTSGFPVGFVIGALKAAHFQNASLGHPISITVMTWLAGCALLIGVRQRAAIVGHGNRRAGVGDSPIRRWWLLVVLALLAATWAFMAAAAWHGAFPQWVSAWRGQSVWTFIAYIAATVILAPLAEELFFRGWLWTGLRQHWRVFPTALVSCGFWPIVHMERGILVPILLIPVAVMLGFARHFCGLRAAMVVHAVYNFVGDLVLITLVTST